MHESMGELPTVIESPEATVRRLGGFGEATGYGEIGAEYMEFAAGTDISPLLEGLPGDLCASPHWGYVIEGRIVLTYGDGAEETTEGGELFYWRPHHTARAEADSRMVLFSPADEHTKVLDHVAAKMGG